MHSTIHQPPLPLFRGGADLPALASDRRLVLTSDAGELKGAANMIQVSAAAMADKSFRLAALRAFGIDQDTLLLRGLDGSAFIVSGRHLTINGVAPKAPGLLRASLEGAASCGELSIDAFRRAGAPSQPTEQRIDWHDIIGVVKIAPPREREPTRHEGLFERAAKYLAQLKAGAAACLGA